MKLDREQQRVANRIKQVGRQVGATPMEIKSALATGIVESGLRNLPGGDADSAGWRQERAQFYKDPTNLEASIRRYFKETRAVRGKYGNAGDLAAAVQRPAAQYRGRYAAVSAQAQKLLGDAGGSAPAALGTPGRTVTTVSGPSEAEQRNALLSDYLTQRGRPGALLGLGTGLANIEAPTTTTTRIPGTKAATTSAPGAAGGDRINVKELYWRGPGWVNMKNGEKVGKNFVSGHDRHVHYAAPTEAGVLKVAKIAQQMGLRVGEHPKFGGVGGGHVPDSNHYAGLAVDVTGPPAKLRAFARRVASMSR